MSYFDFVAAGSIRASQTQFRDDSANFSKCFKRGYLRTYKVTELNFSLTSPDFFGPKVVDVTF